MPNTVTSLLPADVRPVKYRISLAPDLEQFTFAGEEAIDVEVQQTTTQIVLNAADLDIHEAYLQRNGQRLSAASIAVDAAAETATLTFDDPLQTGMTQLHLR